MILFSQKTLDPIQASRVLREINFLGISSIPTTNHINLGQIQRKIHIERWRDDGDNE
jgi:hypothetical protein